MAKRPKFLHLLTPDGWRVDLPESMSRTGKRERRFIQTEPEAKKFAARHDRAMRDNEGIWRDRYSSDMAVERLSKGCGH